MNTIVFRKILAATLFSSKLVGLKLKKYYGGHFLILMYHRILPKEEISECIQPGMYVTPGTFEIHLQLLSRYFKIVSLSEFSSYDKSTAKGLGKYPVCVVTFDDGWQDFYTYAFPILKKYNIPATVFLPTNYIDTKKWFWTDQLSYLLMQRQKRVGFRSQQTGNPFLIKLGRLKGTFENQLEHAIKLLKNIHQVEVEKVLSELADSLGIDQMPAERAFLSWNEVNEMFMSGLIAYGSHTANHPILTTLDDRQIIEELTISRNKLLAEKIVQNEFIPFCYPNGNFNASIVNSVKKIGYSLALTTKTGWNSKYSDKWTLKRVGMHQDMTSNAAMFACKIAGIF